VPLNAQDRREELIEPTRESLRTAPKTVSCPSRIPPPTALPPRPPQPPRSLPPVARSSTGRLATLVFRAVRSPSGREDLARVSRAGDTVETATGPDPDSPSTPSSTNPRPPSHVIAIAGGKGGCGKTTTTLGLARSLVDRGIRTRAVDLDSGMPNLHRLAGVEREPTLGAVEDGRNSGSDPGAVVQRERHGVEVVAAPRATGSVDVPAALSEVALGDGATLLDCPAGAGPGVATPLREADAAILVGTDRPQGVEDAAKTGRMARSLGVHVLGAVVTRTESVSAGVRAELAAERVVGIPFARDPLSDGHVLERLRRVVGWVEAWLRRRAGGRRAAREVETECPRCGATAGDTRRAGVEPARAGTAPRATFQQRESPAVHGGVDVIRPRDRRSRRVRAPGDGRSSSRGGGAPSDRR